MPTRRTIFAGAVFLGLGGLLLSGRADDVMRAAGVRPAPEVRDGDVRLVTMAISENSVLLLAAARLDASFAHNLLQQQIVGLGGDSSEATADNVIDSRHMLSAQITSTAERRRADASVASSVELAQTLASMAAGLAQLAEMDAGSL